MVNSAGEDFFKLSSKVLVGKSIEGILPFSSPILSLIDNSLNTETTFKEYKVDLSTPISGSHKDIDVEVEKEELTQIVKAVRNAMEVVVPGPMKVMRWIESEVSRAIKKGAKELMWVTPSGFRVTQKLMKQES